MENRKSIFITGAASGIGRETALFFAKKDWYVGIVDLNEEGIGSLENEIGKGNCFASIMDVTDPENVKSTMTAFAEKTGGTMDTLFNNAGLLKFGRYEDVDIAIHNKIVDVNVKGIMTCTHCAIPYLKSTPGSHLINMASTSVVYGIPELSVYAATKHAVCALTEAWDIELEQYGITVSDILTPFVKTPMLDTPDDVYSKKTFGIKLVPSDIAEAVWKAVNGKKLHWWLGGSTYALFGIFQVLPFMKRFVIKKLTIK